MYAYKTSERRETDQQLGRLLVFSDLPERGHAGLSSAFLLRGNGVVLPGCLLQEFFTRRLAASRPAGGLLSASHFVNLVLCCVAGGLGTECGCRSVGK